MSETKKENIICPNCGKPLQTMFVPSVNSRRNAKAREQILSDEFFHCSCKQCGYRGNILARCLYHDETHGFMVYLMPEFSGSRLIDAQVEHEFPEMADVPRRVVTGINRMKEKILLLEAGLNDRAVELSKLAVSGLVAQRHNGKIREVYFSEMDEENDRIGFTFFMENESEPIQYRTRAEVYRISQEIVNKHLQAHPENGFCNIDIRWASRVLAEYRRTAE